MVILMEMIVIGVCLAIGFLTYNVCRKKTKSAGEGSLDEKDLDEAYWYSWSLDKEVCYLRMYSSREPLNDSCFFVSEGMKKKNVLLLLDSDSERERILSCGHWMQRIGLWLSFSHTTAVNFSPVTAPHEDRW